MRTVLLSLLAMTVLVGAADPGVPPVPEPSGAICHGTPVDPGVAPATALLPGYGTGGFPIRTASPEAQAYFDNGMQLAHAFAHEAAVAAFKRAEELDPTCAMCVWGEAWSRGPTINYEIKAAKSRALATLADRAAALAGAAPPIERAWIAALQKRYHDGGGAGPGDFAFAGAMDALSRLHPDDDELAVVAADAWLITASQNGNRNHVDRAIELLKAVLARSPLDSGAIHFYIHATEMDGHGADALPAAERLQAAAPAASHLVHMPSHTYFWAGRFRAAEQANLDAVAVEEKDAARLQPKDGIFGFDYHRHNVQFGIVAALIVGDGTGALALAAPMVERLPQITPGDAWPQVALGAAYAAYGRHGTQTQVDALPEPAAELPFARAMWRYAQGEAAARRGDGAAVAEAAAAIHVTDADLAPLGDFAQRGSAMVRVAQFVLKGRAAMLAQHWGAAVVAYRTAADLQDDTLGTNGDPPVWWYPVRRSLAMALLADGKSDEAADEVRRTLLTRIGDPLTERVYADIEAQAGHDAAARRWLDAARSGWGSGWSNGSSGDPAGVPRALI